MKAADIRQGGTYIAKVSGKLTTVRVDQITTRYSAFQGRESTRYHVTNLKTNRKTEFRSAAKFRRPA